MNLARGMSASKLITRSDYQLVTNQVTSDYKKKEAQLIKYLQKVQGFAKYFNFFEIIYMPMEENSQHDML